MATQAETRLSDLRERAAELRTQRDEIDRLLSENEQEQIELTAYIKWQRKFAEDAASSAPPPAPQSTSTLEGQPPPRTVAHSLRIPGGRSPYGTMLAAVQMCIAILRETKKPWQTRELVAELERRGIIVGGVDPIANLSGRLTRSNALRANRVVGWHLAEWPDFPDPTEDNMDALRQKVQGELQAKRAREKVPTLSELSKRAFFGVGVPEAAIAVIAERGRPIGNAEIAEALEAAEYPFGQTDHKSAIESSLQRRMQSRSELAKMNPVIRVAPGTWAMANWYSSEEVKEFVKNLGGVPGRDFAAHREKTRAGVQAAKARGVYFGTVSQFTEEQLALARRMLLVEGVPIAKVAEVFDVSRGCVSKWKVKWSAEEKAARE